MSQHKCILLLGSNLKNPKKNIEKAIKLINNELGSILNKSEFLETKPVEFVSINIFCNIALLIDTQLSPIKLLKSIKRIENEMGRLQDSKVLGCYTDRIIDIDIVTYDGISFKNNFLEIPHKKHLYERDFSKKLINNIINKNIFL